MQIDDLEKRKDYVIQGWCECDLKGIIYFATWLFENFDVLHSPRETNKRQTVRLISLYCLLREYKE